MSPLRKVLLGLSSASTLVLASPIREDLVGRAGINDLLCRIQNPVLTAFHAEASASAFCSTYLSIPVLTFSATVTATTSTSTTQTITTGTETDTAATLTLTDISSTTTTTVTSTTTDDTAPTLLPRGPKPAKTISVPPLLATLAAQALSSACSCLSVPTSSVTNTASVTTTIRLTSSTSTIATTTTTTPVTETSTTATQTATSTAVILKSNVIASLVAVVSEGSYQSFCSDILSYTTPLATVYETTTSTTVTTEGTTTTQTAVVATVTVTVPAVAKRQDSSDPTPTALAGFPADYVTSACSLAVTSPATSTISSTIIDTATQTTVQVSTQTILATATATTTAQPAPPPSSNACSPSPGYVMLNGGFECGSLSPWVIGQNQGGTVDIVAGGKNSANALHVWTSYYTNSQATHISIYQVLNTVPGQKYQISFDRSGGGGGGNNWNVAVGSNPAFAAGDSGGMGQGDWTSTPFTTTFTAVGQDRVTLTFSSTDWAYAEFWFDNFVVTKI